VYAYDFGDTSKLTPLVKMHTLGHGFVPAGIHAGGLRYHGMAPMVSHLYEMGLIRAEAVHQTKAFESAVQFARTEGILPAPESTHAIRVAVEQALAAKESGDQKTILIGLSGHGHFDLAAYDSYLTGKMRDTDYPSEAVEAAMADLPVIAAP
jgi:tryptophan synthase beta chain